MGEDTTTFTLQFVLFALSWLCILGYLGLALYDRTLIRDSQDTVPVAAPDEPLSPDTPEPLPPDVFAQMIGCQVQQVLIETGWSQPVATSQQEEEEAQ